MARGGNLTKNSAANKKQQLVVKKPKFKVGDEVEIISGRAKGQSGPVLLIDKKRGYVVVKETNMIKRHTKARQPGQKGEVVQKEGPVHISNVKVLKKNG